MATRTAILAVNIVSDARDFTRGIDDSVSRLDKFQNKMNKLTMPATAILGGLALVGKGFFDAASAAEQAQGGVQAVFGQWSKDVDKFASDSANRLGLSGQAYDKLASVIGNSLKSSGVPMDQLAKKTDELTSLGADLASVFGGTTTEAVDAMGAAFRGEYDSLERFGVILNDSTIMAALKEKGLDKLTGSALTAAKQQEVYNQLMEKGAPFMGNFAKEADTAAGAQERLAAKFEDVSAQLGTALLPYMVQLAEAATGIATWVSENIGLVQGLAVGLGILAGAVLILNAAMFAMNVIAALNPFVFLAVAVAALIAVIVYLATQTTFFQDVWAKVASTATALWEGFTRAVSDAWNGFWSTVSQGLSNIGNHFNTIFNGARNIAMSVINAVVGGFNNIVSGAKNAMNWVRNLFNGFSVPGWLRDVMRFMGVGGTGFEFVGDFPQAFAMGAPGEMGIGATGGMSLGAVFGGGGKAPAIEQTTVNITVNGALDSSSVAEQVFNLVQRHSKNTGQQVAVRIA